MASHDKGDCPGCVSLEVIAAEVLRDLESEVCVPLGLGDDPEARELMRRAAEKLRAGLTHSKKRRSVPTAA